MVTASLAVSPAGGMIYVFAYLCELLVEQYISLYDLICMCMYGSLHVGSLLYELDYGFTSSRGPND